jgi:Tfp pilus assembly PilM family ATPase
MPGDTALLKSHTPADAEKRGGMAAQACDLVRGRTRRSAITLDVGAAGIRICQCRGRQARGQVLSELRLEDVLGVERLPSEPNGDEAEARPSGSPEDGAQLHRLLGQGRFTGRDVVLVLSPPDVEFHPLRLPEAAFDQAPERIEQALKWEVARGTRGEASELEVRYWKLPPARGLAANVMAVVAPTATALRWCTALAGQHLVLKRLEVSPCALVRAARVHWSPATDDLWGLLDLGLRHSTLTLAAGTTPIYIRVLTSRAHDWTRRLASAFEISYTQAEQLKRSHGLLPGRSASAAAADTPPLADGALGSAFSGVLREPLHDLAVEIGRCFGYVMQSYSEHVVRRLLLAGGGAGLPGLAAVLEAELDIPVAPLVGTPGAADKTAGRSGALDLRDARMTVALGGALLDLENR